MVRIEDAVIAKYEKAGKRFEILVDPIKAQAFLDGKAKINEVLAVEEIFKDVGAAERTTEDNLKSVFKTTDVHVIAEQILKQGEVQLTTDQRRKMVEEKRNRIIDLIVRNAVDPKTNLPHPRTRIESALEQVRLNVDPFKSAEEQVDATVKELRPIIPLKFEKKKLAIKFPALYAMRAYPWAKSMGIQKEQWLNDGSLIVVVEIPGGLQTEVIDKANSLSKGECEVKILE